ncbi:orotate phosphoribosyltransferase [Actinomarinicola tropica]|uniref:Orotate phosphoribosyltransferase n=1 Tax=Actinomarinicola tropica TaxID=2789776 RepID=A0A5Q2RQP8_9ACTN|nr:orotate phosphoribosyltransferase [Actinomarinicola tropica]QGG96756.1 orotate phosphoribosyltransferase [Actinomarinicola tropica]
MNAAPPADPTAAADLEARRADLVAHLLAHSVRTGDFVLKSGKPTTWFIDSKQTACRPDGILLVADVALALLPDDITAIGGLTAGADPVAFGIAAVAATRGRELRSFSIRKEAKDHGVTGRLAGALQEGDRVAIVEDTVTRGSSPMEAAAVVRELGAEPVLIMPIVDRGGSCGALAEAEGIRFLPLVTAPDLGFAYEG